MEEIFVTKVRINKVLHLENLEIPLSDTERKHLILTGKNGSGKTSVLKGIVTFLDSTLAELASITENELNQYVHNALSGMKLHEELQKDPTQWGRRGQLAMRVLPALKEIEEKYPVQLFSNSDLYNKNDGFQSSVSSKKFTIKYFEAKRNPNYNKPENIQKIDLESLKQKSRSNQEFLNYLVQLRTEKAFAFEEGNNEKVKEIDAWFSKFEKVLKIIFDTPELTYTFERSGFSYNFKLHIPNRVPFDFMTLSDGYAAVLDIVTELIMWMESKASQIYNLQGIVLIDEIETHLHIDLQKKILPFLTAFFPKIQFIVTTHSPFVLNSIDNAVIYDLEKQIRVEDLSGYSVEGIIEGYFDNEKYSESIKKKINEYEELMEKDILNDSQKDRLYFLDQYLEELPDFMSPELQVKIQQIKLAKLV